MNSLFLLQPPLPSLLLHFSESFKTFSSLISSVCLSAALSRSRKLSYYPFFAKLLVPALSPRLGIVKYSLLFVISTYDSLTPRLLKIWDDANAQVT